MTAAFTDGRQAALNSLSPSLNPFELGTPENEQWQLGWQDGCNALAAYANAKSRREWWENRTDFDMTTSGARLRPGS